MASINTGKNGKRRILFLASDGKRKTIWLGKMPLKQAEEINRHIQQIVSDKMSQTIPSNVTSRWIANLAPVMAEKLSKVGLIDKRSNPTIGGFLSQYIASRTELKDRTINRLELAARNLNNYLGKDKLIRDISPADADGYRIFLIDKGNAENTIRRNCGRAKQFFNAAIKQGLIERNPFESLKSTVMANPNKFHFITREEADKVIEACPDAEWRLLFALARYGGLRSPSETLSLRWADILWDKGRMIVQSPKTAHIAGKESRIVPLFPELLPFLNEVWEQTEPGTEFVINRYRGITTNLGTQLTRIIKRAGLPVWKKLWQNLRSTRQTELMEYMPSHVVCSWIGNSIAVAEKHYLQVTEEHFKKVTGIQSDLRTHSAQHVTNSSRTALHQKNATLQNQCYATPYDTMRSSKYPVEDLNPCHRTESPGS